VARPTATRIVGSATVPTVNASTGPWLMGFAVRINLSWAIRKLNAEWKSGVEKMKKFLSTRFNKLQLLMNFYYI
jgi:hypothetical protein